MLSTWVPEEVEAAFKAHARSFDGGTAAALRRLIAQEISTPSPAEGLHGARPALAAIGPTGVGKGEQVGVRLKAPERAALAQAAKLQGTSPANWLRSLAIVHLARRPQWNPAELEALRDLFRELRTIGNNVNQIANMLNSGPDNRQYSSKQGTAAYEAADLVRAEMRRVVAVMTGNFAYWGLPEADKPMPAPGASERENDAAKSGQLGRKLRPKRRPARFADES